VDSGALAVALSEMELDQETLTALVSGDTAALTSLLGASSNVVCGLFPGKEEEEEEEESPDKDDGRDPDREEDPNTSIRQSAVFANAR